MDRRPDDEPHDILAAEEFAMPAGPDAGLGGVPVDPSGSEQPHDVLAAEEFAIPAHPDAPLSQVPVDPSGSPQPHDVLAAEEFGMPAGPDAEHHEARSGPPLAAAAALGALAGAAFYALRRRR